MICCETAWESGKREEKQNSTEKGAKIFSSLRRPEASHSIIISIMIIVVVVVCERRMMRIKGKDARSYH
jgi:hypothetical protein